MDYKKFVGKRVLDIGEPDEGSFDILQIHYYESTPTTFEESFYQIIAYQKNFLYVITCSELFFNNLKIEGYALDEKGGYYLSKIKED